MYDLPTEILCYILEYVCGKLNSPKLVCRKWYAAVLCISKKHQKANMLYIEYDRDISLKETMILSKIIHDKISNWKRRIGHIIFDSYKSLLYNKNVNIDSGIITLEFYTYSVYEDWYKFNILIKHGNAALVICGSTNKNNKYEVIIHRSDIIKSTDRTYNEVIHYLASFANDHSESDTRIVFAVIKHLIEKLPQIL
jgi:hypothetical protein